MQPLLRLPCFAVKPANILLGGTKRQPLVKLIDFGFSQPAGKRLKFSGGTPAYMAPEISFMDMANGRLGRPSDYMPKYFPGQDQHQASAMIDRFKVGLYPEQGDIWCTPRTHIRLSALVSAARVHLSCATGALPLTMRSLPLSCSQRWVCCCTSWRTACSLLDIHAPPIYPL